METRTASKFWESFKEDEFRIIIGRFLEGFQKFEPTGFLGVGDARGLAELQTYFESLGIRNPSVSYADRLGGDLKNNFIILGGPDANEITKAVMSHLNPRVNFGDPAIYEITLNDSVKRMQYTPDRDKERITTDYGIILKAPNPFALDKQIILIAGCFGYGTWAAVRYMISKEFIEDPLVLGGKSIECLIKTDIVQDTPQNPTRIFLQEYASAQVEDKRPKKPVAKSMMKALRETAKSLK